VPAAGRVHQPAGAQPESRRRADRQEAFHPVVPGLALPSGPELRRARALPTPDVRAAGVAACCRAWALLLERARRRVRVIPPGAAARQDVRRAEVRRGDQPAVRREPALRLAQASSSVPGSPLELAWPLAQAHRGGPGARLSEQAVLPSAQARGSAGPAEPLREAAAEAASGEPQAAAWWGPAAAAPPQEAVRAAAWEPGVRRAEAAAGQRGAQPEAAVSGLAAAGRRPEAAKAASEQQAAAGAAEAPDGLQGEAAAEVPGGPQGEAEAVAALPGAAVLRPAEELQAAGAVQPPAAEPRGVRVLQAAPRLAVPSAAALVFRQGPRPAAGPERRRTAQRLAHAMRCWPIASRSEPSSQAARNEGWSCGELPRKVLVEVSG